MNQGDVIFSRTSWGRNEAKTEFGIILSKPTLGSLSVAEEYWASKSGNYEDLSLAVDELVLFSQRMSATISGTVCREALRMTWESWQTGFSQIEEKILFRKIIVDIGTVFKLHATVGRNQFRQALLMKVCNSIGENK